MNISPEARPTLERVSLADLRLAHGAVTQAHNTREFPEYLAHLYAAPAFLESRLSWDAAGPAKLLQDLEILSDESPWPQEFGQIRDAFRLSMDILARDPSQLCPQFVGRLSPDNAYVSHFIENLKREHPRALTPIRSALIPAAQAFTVLRAAPAEILEVIALEPLDSFATLVRDGSVQLFSSPDFHLRHKARIPGAVGMICLPDMKSLLVATESGLMFRIDAETFRLDEQAALPAHEILGLAQYDQERIILQHKDGTSLVQISNARELTRFGLQEGADFFISALRLPNTDCVVTGGADGRIDLWDSRTGRHVRRVGWFGKYRDDFMSRNEGMMRTFAEAGLWLSRGEGSERIDLAAQLRANPNLTPDQRGSLLNMLDEEQLQHAVLSLAVTPDGETVIAADRSGELVAWRLADGVEGKRLQRQLPQDDEPSQTRENRGFTRLSVSTDGSHLVTVDDGSVRVWDLTGYREIASLPVRDPAPVVVCFDGKRDEILGGCPDGSLMRWKSASGFRSPAGHSGAPTNLTYQPAGKSVLGLKASGRLLEWSAETGADLGEYSLTDNDLDKIVADSTGRRAVGWRGELLTVFDLGTRLPLYSCKHDWNRGSSITVPPRQRSLGIKSGIQEAAIDPAGTSVLLWATDEPVGAESTGSGALYLVRFPEASVCLLAEKLGAVEGLAISPDGSAGVAVIRTLTMWRLDIWDLASRTLLRQEKASGDVSHSPAFLPDSESLLWVQGNKLKKTSVRSSEPTKDFLIFSTSCWAATLTRDVHAVAFTEHNTLEFVDLTERRVMERYTGDHRFRSCVLSPSNGYLFVSDVKGGLHILDTHFCTSELDKAVDDARTEPRAPITALLDEVGALEAKGRSNLAMEMLEGMGSESANAPELRLGIARRLALAGRHVKADNVLAAICANAAFSDEFCQHFLDVCYRLPSARGVSKFLRMDRSIGSTPSTLAQAVRASEWLAGTGHNSMLNEIANDKSAPPLHRLISSETLAARNDPSGPSLILEIANDAALDQDVRCLAWCDMRRLMEPLQWLDAIVAEFGGREWSPRARRTLAAELLTATSISGGILEIHHDGLIRTTGILRTANEWNTESIRLVARGEFDEAIGAATNAIRRRPDGARYYLSRASAQLGIARRTHQPAHFRKAIADLSRAIELDATFDRAWSQRGYARLELGDYHQALTDINRGIELDASDWTDYENRSYCLRQLGRLEDAKRDDTLADRMRRPGGSGGLAKGKPRIGDEPWPSDRQIALVRQMTMDALTKLGLMDSTIDVFVEHCRNPTCSTLTSSEIITQLAGIGAWPALRSLMTDHSLALEKRIVAAESLVASKHNDDALEFLISLAVDTTVSENARQGAGHFITDRRHSAKILERLLHISKNRSLDDEFRARMIALLASHGPSAAVSTVLCALAADEQEPSLIREASVWTLGDLRCADALKQLTLTLTNVGVTAQDTGMPGDDAVKFDVSPSARVCMVACKQLGALHDEKALFELANNNGLGALQRNTAAEVLLVSGRLDLAIPVFLSLARSRMTAPTVRLLAANDLASSGLISEARQAMTDVARDNRVQPGLREKARYTITQLG